jgi:hypothetical protein
MGVCLGRNSEGVAPVCDYSGNGVATLSGLRLKIVLFSQGFKANPGLELANAFGVKTS